jgi:hypothetical protein
MISRPSPDDLGSLQLGEIPPPYILRMRAQRAPRLPLTHPTRPIRRGAVIASTRTDAIGNERIESFCGVATNGNEPLARDSSLVAMCSVIGVDSGR